MVLDNKLFSDSDIISIADIMEKSFSIKTDRGRKDSFKSEVPKNLEELEMKVFDRNNYFYIPVWINKDTKKTIANFSFSTPNILRFNNDIDKLGEVEQARLEISMNSMERPSYNLPCVFIDDDKMLGDGKYDDPSNEIRYHWDTETHALSRFFVLEGEPTDCLVFSKTLSDEDRLTYRVFRPEYDSRLRKWISKVEYSRCHKHQYENQTYADKWKKVTIADTPEGRKLIDFKKAIKNKSNLRSFSEVFDSLGILRIDKSLGYGYVGPSLNELDW